MGLLLTNMRVEQAQSKRFAPPIKSPQPAPPIPPMLQLQRSIGNQGVQHLLASQQSPSKCACGGGCPRCRGNHHSAEAMKAGTDPHITPRSANRNEALKLFDPGPGGFPGGLQQEEQTDQLKNTASTSGAKIDIEFDPATSTKVTTCDEIVHTQVTKLLVDGVETKPGDYYSGYKFRDATLTDALWHVDHLSTETSPDYQQGSGVGSKNGATKKATFSDTPGTGGGDKGFYHPTTNTGGIKKFNPKFVAFAWCMKGTDCPKFYEGMSWEFVKTWENQRDGDAGASTVTSSNIDTPPTTFTDAFKKFNKVKSYTPC